MMIYLINGIGAEGGKNQYIPQNSDCSRYYRYFLPPILPLFSPATRTPGCLGNQAATLHLNFNHVNPSFSHQFGLNLKEMGRQGGNPRGTDGRDGTVDPFDP